MRTRPEAGFTIIEVLLAILIMGMMLTAITQLMTAARNTRDSVHNMQETQLAGPAVLDIIETDLRSIFTTGLPRAHWFKIEDRVSGGLDADRIDFISTTDSLIARIEDRERPRRSDINEVGYVLRRSPRNDEFLEIYRREGFGVDREPFIGGEYTFLTDQVKGLDIRAYPEDGRDIDPLDEWDSGSDQEDRGGLPAAIKLAITIELKPRIDRESLDLANLRKRTVTYTRWIRLPQDLRFAEGQFPRLVVPPSATTPTDPATPPAGSAAGGTDPNAAGGGGARGGAGGAGEDTGSASDLGKRSGG